MAKCDLMEHFQFISFAIDDLRLFLDTHPCNREALEYIGELMKIRHTALKIYTKKYGPIYSYNIDVEDGWTWNEQPLPWSKGGM
ncbi:MAG: spore coat protein CotJB [Lachnospiraceae bacterium]|nr:spore coat protein CotJB [Lachnospiraceae bacterium]MDE6697872.1 spore coat protein CotJB [Lachnospiraceae bacterium]